MVVLRGWAGLPRALSLWGASPLGLPRLALSSLVPFGSALTQAHYFLIKFECEFSAGHFGAIHQSILLSLKETHCQHQKSLLFN